MNIRKAIASMVGLLGLAAAVVPAHAQYVTLAPTGNVASLKSVAPVSGTVVAQIIGEAIPASISGSALPTGTFSEYVYRQANNSLIFTFQIDQTSAGTNSFSNFNQLSAEFFGGFDTSVAFNATGAVGSGSTGTSYSASRTSNGNQILFNFPADFGNGSTTPMLIIATNAAATTALPTTALDYIQNGGQHMVAAYGPAYSALGKPILAPEPTTVAAFGFIGLGILGLAFRARRGTAKMQMTA